MKLNQALCDLCMQDITNYLSTRLCIIHPHSILRNYSNYACYNLGGTNIHYLDLMLLVMGKTIKIYGTKNMEQLNNIVIFNKHIHKFYFNFFKL